jgi:hypothetical protein
MAGLLAGAAVMAIIAQLGVYSNVVLYITGSILSMSSAPALPFTAEFI